MAEQTTLEQSTREIGVRPPAITGMGALAGIWASVAAISVFAPDLVSGSEQQHLPVAAFTTWFWGVVASGSVLAAMLRVNRVHGPCPLSTQLTGAVCAIWVVAALVSIFSPEMVTGSDPTRLPLAALIAPVAAAVLTMATCGAVTAFSWAGRQR
jgi:hypothetical protein